MAHLQAVADRVAAKKSTVAHVRVVSIDVSDMGARSERRASRGKRRLKRAGRKNSGDNVNVSMTRQMVPEEGMGHGPRMIDALG
jgi:hypothetical protein